jgi:hypothetical protein
MPRKKLSPDENPLTDEMVDEPVVTDPPTSVFLRIWRYVRQFPLQFLCAGLLIALGVMTLLYSAERSQSSRDLSREAAHTSPSSGLDTTKDAAVLQAVSELMILPSEPDPIIALVADAARLQAEQAFYRGAENGDVLLVFPQSRQAIIYRPSSNKIVNAGPLIVDGNE